MASAAATALVAKRATNRFFRLNMTGPFVSELSASERPLGHPATRRWFI
jgi:hypothetical protein